MNEVEMDKYEYDLDNGKGDKKRNNNNNNNNTTMNYNNGIIGLGVKLLSRCFTLDCRSLALFRVCLSFATLCDLLERSLYLKAHYTSEGVLPRYAAAQHFSNSYHFSVHLINDSFYFQALLFLLNSIFVICVMVGWKTKIFTFLSWFWVASLQSRNPLVLHGGDTIMRLMWFYSIYFPTNTCFSIDACLQNGNEKRGNSKSSYAYFGLGSIAYFIQLTFTYITAFSEKASVRDWQTGDTTFYVLQIGYFATFVARFFLNFPKTVNLLTRAVLYWELIGPLLLYVPIFTEQIRMFAVIGLMGMHLGFAMCLRLGVFTIIALSGLTAAIPSIFWDFMFLKFLNTRERRQLTIYSDPRKAISRGTARFLTTFCLIPGTLSCALDDPSLISSNSPSSPSLSSFRRPWLAVTDVKGVTYENESALHEVLKYSPLFWFIPKMVNRSRLGRFTNLIFSELSQSFPDVPNPPAPRNRAQERLSKLGKRAAAIALIVVMTSLIFHNGNPSLPAAIQFDYDRLEPFLHVSRVHQYWTMFSRPPKNTFWIRLKGTLANGEVVDIFKNRGLANWEGGVYDESEKPEVHANFLNHRWYKYFEGSLAKVDPNLRPYFTNYICNEWNSRNTNERRLEFLGVSYVYEQNHLTVGERKQDITTTFLYDQKCP